MLLTKMPKLRMRTWLMMRSKREGKKTPSFTPFFSYRFFVFLELVVVVVVVVVVGRMDMNVTTFA